ncbi:nucleoside diphosphate kinase, mitochondrial isoform X3 [Trichechus manatus latirostris]|uniref:Nucleoside diphosphate kinase n=1 Tax=Trichechus manatus latirostris TaxID=127582 RepID=A0A2Y9QXH1_TRIMA|nr:nucleoside diphosphate kinase, mitochondrial isoform X3 [Trichechus manatus latirostris]
MRVFWGRVALRGLLCGSWAPGPSPLRHSSGGPSWTQERTLVAVKPDGVRRRLVGDVIRRFERRGFKLVGMKMLQVWEGHNVVHASRAMIGDTDAAEAAPGTIRGDFGVHISRNVIHASDSVEGAQREIGLWFRSSELVDWPDRGPHSSVSPA